MLIIAGCRQSLHLLHRIGHLTAHRINQDVLTAHLRLILCHHLVQVTDDIGIESAAQTAVGGKHHHGHFLHFTFHCKRRFHAQLRAQEITEHTVQPAFVGKHIFNGLLRLVQLGRRHHLHRRSNLQRAVD